MNSNETSLNPHIAVAKDLIAQIWQMILAKNGPYVISVAGESGSGKTETGAALFHELKSLGKKSVVINQDNYFLFSPALNDAKRKADPTWLGPHKEVNMSLLQKTIIDFTMGLPAIEVPFMDYHSNTSITQSVSLLDVEILILEGTYVSLLKNIDTRIFITADYNETLPYRKKRNRGNEVNDPFIENILETEHKIIAGHKFLADWLILNDLTLKRNV